MKTIGYIGLALITLAVVGCSSDKVAEPADAEVLDFNVIGDDAPADVESALGELNRLGVTVPDPVLDSDPAVTEVLDLRRAAEIISNANLDDEGRRNFRRIITHLNDQMQLLRRCMHENPDPALRRLAYGASHAIHHGLRLIQAGEPRLALRYFRQANRVLNLAHRICLEGNGGRP